MSTPADYGRARPGRNQGVIHDLGYRHYDGPRLGRAVITRALFVESAKGAYGLGRSARSKVMPMILLAAMCLPAIIIAIVTVVTKADAPSYTAYLLNTELLVMVYVAGQAPASVSRDLRFRVISLYFSRPIRRIDYVAAKYAAMAVALLVFMVLPLTILFAGALLAKLPIGDQVPNYLRSLAGAVLLALVLAGIGLVIAALTPRRGLGVAAVIAVLAMLAGVQAAVQAIADDQGRDTFAGYAGLISPFTIVDGVQSALLGADTVLPAQPPGIAGGLVFLLAALLIVAGSFGALLMRYRKVSI
ncbi:MAG: type transport system permease protein [Pseudonocardiales bacterium]|jgi:ABC-2 type transport system permease protein|nr:type transport system permease protein [Pseudonocardiales bacterium]